VKKQKCIVVTGCCPSINAMLSCLDDGCFLVDCHYRVQLYKIERTYKLGKNRTARLTVADLVAVYLAFHISYM